MNGSNSDEDCLYDDEELDEEALEDIEISLYGLLHHAPNEELDSTGSSSENADCATSSSLVSNVTQNVTPNYQYEGEDFTKKTEDENSRNLQSANQLGSHLGTLKRSVTENSDPLSSLSASQSSLSNSLTTHSSDESFRRKHLVSSLTSGTVAKITDCEDSKYTDIDNKLHQGTLVPHRQSQPTEDDSSDDDSSVLILNHTGDEGQHVTDDSSTDDDSDVQLLDEDLASGDNSMTLNISGIHQELVEVRESTSSVNWKKYACSKWTEEMIRFYNGDDDIPDLEQVKKSLPISRQHWRLDDADRYGDNVHRNRYFGHNTNQRCANCLQRDHIARHCPDPPKQKRCHYCGTVGHTHFRCPNKICLGCGRPWQVFVECCPDCRKERSVICMICKLNHTTQQCPDLWRRYHLTTTQSSYLTTGNGSVKPRQDLNCCNCAGRGHLWFDCKDIRYSKYPVAKPYIFSYEDSKQFLNRVTDGGKKSVVASEDRKSFWVVGSPPKGDLGKKHMLSYSFHPGDKISERRIKLAETQVHSEFNSIDISWRKQKKTGRYIVEFRGKADKQEARKRFKKLLHMKSNMGEAAEHLSTNEVSPQRKEISSRSNTSSSDRMHSLINGSVNSNQAGPSNAAGTQDVSHGKFVRKKPVISSVAIRYMNGENKELHCLNRVPLTAELKKSLGKLMAKCQNRFRVPITSSVIGAKWEIYIGYSKLAGLSNQSSQAFRCINRFLQTVKTDMATPWH